jgi:adenosylcobinamide-GDP ribazoletransferase
VRDFVRALSFLTILPVGQNQLSGEKELARSMAFFPLVGLVIGLILSAGYYLFSLFLPRSITLWSTVGLLAFLTRGLHLDGLADTLDGLASGRSKEGILEVMRDSRIGAFGVIGLILLIGGKYLSLDQLSNAFIPYALILMAVMGRNSMVLVCYRSPYARPQGLGKPFSENLKPREMIISLTSTCVIAFIVQGWKGFLLFVAICLFSLGYRFFFMKKLGGITGDVLGGANELSELLCLILLVILERIQL